MDYNPNSPETLGLEWLPHTASGHPVDALGKATAIRFTAEENFSPDRLSMDLTSVTQQGRFIAELYESGDVEAAIPDDVTISEYNPNADLVNEDKNSAGGADWQNQAGSTVNIYGSIDESGDTDANDWIAVGEAVKATKYAANFGTAAWPADRRVTGIYAYVACSMISVNISGTTLQCYYTDGSTDYVIGSANVRNALQFGRHGNGLEQPIIEFRLYEENPITHMPWTRTDIQDLDSTAGFGVLWPYVDVQSVPAVYQFYVNIHWIAENRVGYGVDWVSAAGDNTWASVQTPAGGAIALTQGTEYILLLRRFGTTGAVSHAFCSGRADEDLPSGDVSYEPTLYPLSAAVAYLGAGGNRGYNWRLWDSSGGGDYMANSQIYGRLVDGAVNADDGTVEQEFTTPNPVAAGGYSFLRFRARRGTALTQGADLTVRIKDRASSTTQATVTLTEEQFEALLEEGNGWRLVEKELSAAFTPSTSTQYYIEWEANNAAGGDDSWIVAVLDNSEQQGNNYQNTEGFGGTTDRATVNGVEQVYRDVPFTLHEAADTPTIFGVDVTTVAVNGDKVDACFVTSFDRVDITWTATAMGGDFLRYEIERSIDGGVTWDVIAKISAEAVEEFRDYETPRGLTASYRMRSRRVDQAPSAYTTADTVTPVAYGQELCLVSNERPSLNLYLAEVSDRAETETTFLAAEEATFQPVYGRDYAIESRPIEYRGRQRRAQLILDANNPDGTQGQAVFDAFEELCHRTTLSYVCVLDADGNAWLASVRAASGVREGTSGLYWVDAEIRQITDRPSTPDVA